MYFAVGLPIDYLFSDEDVLRNLVLLGCQTQKLTKLDSTDVELFVYWCLIIDGSTVNLLINDVSLFL